METVLHDFPEWRSQAAGGTLWLRNEAQDLTLTVKRLPFHKTVLSGEVRLDGPSGRSILTLAMAEDVPDEVVERFLRCLRFDRELVMALLTRLLPVIRSFLLLKVPE